MQLQNWKQQEALYTYAITSQLQGSISFIPKYESQYFRFMLTATHTNTMQFWNIVFNQL